MAAGSASTGSSRSRRCGARSWCSASGPSPAPSACGWREDLRQLQRRFPEEVAVVGRALPQVPVRRRSRGAGAGRRPPPHRLPGARRPRHGHLAAVRRAGLADARRRRPRGATWWAPWPVRARARWLHQIVQDLVEEHRRKTNLQRTPVPVHLPVIDPARRPGGLFFPSKVASDRHGRLAISDTGNDRVVVVELHRRAIGGGSPTSSPGSASRRACGCTAPTW